MVTNISLILHRRGTSGEVNPARPSFTGEVKAHGIVAYVGVQHKTTSCLESLANGGVFKIKCTF